MNNKFSLDDLSEIINDPSFDSEACGNKIQPIYVMKFILDAIDHHNELEKFENRRGI